MRVLLVNTLFEPHILGGAERSVKLLALHLKRRGLYPVVVTTSSRNEKGMVDGIPVYYVKTPNIYWPYLSKRKPQYLKPLWHAIDAFNLVSPRIIQDIWKRERMEILHTNNLAGFSPSIWNMDVPKVHTIRDMYLMCIRSTMFRNGRDCRKQCTVCSMYSFPKKIMSQKVEAVTGISRYVLEKHIRAGYFEKAGIRRVIYNPIEKLNGMMNRVGRTIVFGYAGSLVPHKGVELLLEVFSGIQREDAVLKIFGKSPSPEYGEKLKRKYGSERVIFMGFHPEEEIYSRINVFIVPSLWNEPFGRVIPEAYSHGIPVIASKKGGIPEIVIDGKTGFLFDSREQLRDRLLHFLENREDIVRMGENALEYARNFLPQNTLEKFIEIYGELI